MMLLFVSSPLMASLLLLSSVRAANTRSNMLSRKAEWLPLRVPARQLIVGGQPADPGRFPYFARLDYDGIFGCGGTLVKRDFILSASHCAIPEEDLGILTVTVGAMAYETNNNTRFVTKIIRHPTYDDDSDINDIALLKIDPPVDENIPVPKINSRRDVPEVGDSVTVIGLGLTANNGVDAEVLQEVELKVLDDEICDERYEGYIHRKSMICAKDPNQDACDGDSGGMLAVLGETPGDDVQIGVVSFGHDCAHETLPGVYADVSYVYDWLESTLCEHSVDPPPGCRNASSSFIIGDGEECRDYPGAFYVNWWFQFQRCDWLHGRVEQYCVKDTEAWIQCPFTCHSCTYQTDDDVLMSDDETYYRESSPTAIMAMLLILSGLVCCGISVGCLRLARQSCRKSSFKDEPMEENRFIASAAGPSRSEPPVFPASGRFGDEDDDRDDDDDDSYTSSDA